MPTINIDKREVSKLNRNGRINTSGTNTVAGSSNNSSSSGIQYVFDNGIDVSGNVVSFSGNYVGDTSIIGDLYVSGNIKASLDVIAYFISEASSGILDVLTTSYPLLKTGTNLSLKYNTSQFELINNELSLKSGSVGGTSTIAGATDVSSYFSGTKALTSMIADSVAWNNVSGKPTLFNGAYSSLTGVPTSFTPSGHTQDWSTITGKPSFFDGYYSSLYGIPSTFAPSPHTVASHTDAANYYNTNTATLPAQTFNIKNSGGSVVWSITLNGTDLIFTNSSGVRKAKIDQSGNFTVAGDVTSFGTI